MTGDIDGACGWGLFEVVRRPADQKGFVVSDELRDLTPTELRHIKRELRALQAAGIPAKTELGAPIVQDVDVTCHGEHHKTTFYVLKCRPGHWRLYFFVDHTRKHIVFLHAVIKKKDKRNVDDYKVCCSRFKEYREAKRRALSPFDGFLA